MYAAAMASKDLTPAPGEIAALLGRGTKFRGKLVFEGRVRVDGAFDGEVHTEGVLVVGEEAVLDGTFDVGSLLVLGGTVRGKVRAREVIELHADSHVLAELETPRLFVDKGARFDGSCRMTDGAPSERLPLDESERPGSSGAPSVAASPSTESTQDASPSAGSAVEASADEGTEESVDRRDVPDA
jgi:cytoskeletal protein CcmA (bactofilin family)